MRIKIVASNEEVELKAIVIANEITEVLDEVELMLSGLIEADTTEELRQLFIDLGFTVEEYTGTSAYDEVLEYALLTSEDNTEDF